MVRISHLIRLGLLLGGVVGTPALAQQTGAPPNSPPPGGGVHKFADRFNAANTTHDGHLTLDQARNGHMPFIVRHFTEIDTRNNGYVTLDDLRAYRQRMHAGNNAPPTNAPAANRVPGGGAGKFAARFKAANTTGDGHLTQDQARAGHMPFVAAHFAEIDAQNKGFVTVADIRAYRQKTRAAQTPANTLTEEN